MSRNDKLYEGKWEVCIHGELGEENLEISLIRPYNEHGKNSWGWDEVDHKIILFNKNNLFENIIRTSLKTKQKEAIEFTQRICAFLNSNLNQSLIIKSNDCKIVGMNKLKGEVK